MDPLRRRLALSPLALGLAWGAAPAAHAAALPAAQSLGSELAQALRAGKPLVVMASLDGCPYCRLVRDNYLAPLLREGAIAVVQLDMQSAEAVTGFDGARSTHQAMLRGWSVKVAPTLLFFGKGAREAAPRLEGASIPDFYGAYLDERLRTARRALG
ncbi:MAG: thioredoxin family protein [Ramlibacter sp.]|nr:thioredoxin family protein [Ramlibacter sp.]